MPTITNFYGLSIRMNFRQKEHNPPHIHVSYGGAECLMDVRNGCILEGKIPPRAAGMAAEWTLKHSDELIEMWNTQKFRELPPLE